MLVPLRLGLRRVRLELLILLSVSLMLCAGAAVAAVAIAHDNDVVRSCLPTGDCSSTGGDLSTWSSWVLYLRVGLVAVSVIAGAMFGTSLVASELEQGTTPFAWCVIVKRRTWLIDACATGLAAILLISVPNALATGGLGFVLGSTVLGPMADTTYSPSGVDMAPVLLIMRAVLALSIAALVGIVSGRTLPTLVFGVLLALVILVTLEGAFATWRNGAVVPIDASAPGAYYVSEGAIGADGRVISSEDAYARADELGRDPDELYRFVPLGLTSATRISMLALESGVLLALSGGGLIAAGFVAARRRPV